MDGLIDNTASVPRTYEYYRAGTFCHQLINSICSTMRVFLEYGTLDTLDL